MSTTALQPVHPTTNGNGHRTHAEDLAIPGTLTETSLSLPPNLPFEKWIDTIDVLKRIGRSVHWWLGDALAYGERRYGEVYSQAVDQTDYVYGSLADMKWVASAIPPQRRHPQLSWTHHRYVAPLDQHTQDLLLDYAETHNLSTRDMLDHVHRVKAGLVNPITGESTDPTPLIPPHQIQVRTNGVDLAADYEVKHMVCTQWEPDWQSEWRDRCRRMWRERYEQSGGLTNMRPFDNWVLYEPGDYMEAAQAVRKARMKGTIDAERQAPI